MTDTLTQHKERTYTRTVKFGEILSLPANVVRVQPVFLRRSGSRIRLKITVAEWQVVDRLNSQE